MQTITGSFFTQEHPGQTSVKTNLRRDLIDQITIQWMRSSQKKTPRFPLCPRFITLTQNFRRMVRVSGDIIVLDTAELSYFKRPISEVPTFQFKARQQITFFQNGGALNIPLKPNLTSQNKNPSQKKNIYSLVGSYLTLLSMQSRCEVIFVSCYICPITSTQDFLQRSEDLTLSG